MKKLIGMMIAALSITLLTAALGVSSPSPIKDRDRDRDYPVQKKEEIQKTLKFADTSKPGELVLDNVFGPIKVEGYAGKDVLLIAHKTVYAKTAEKASLAEGEVKLDITEKGRTVDVYVDGPFRDNERGRHEHHSWRDPGYEVYYAFEIKVPVRTDLAVSTVMGGDVEVSGVEGEFDVHNVNGKVRMSDVAGSGEVQTVNGELVVGFRRVPADRCVFKTINGDVIVTLPADTSADFRLKTFNGEAWSDFPVSALPLRQATREESHENKGKFMYKADRSIGVRMGKGGPEILMDTMNGDLLIKKRAA
jgi:hypothetical protein